MHGEDELIKDVEEEVKRLLTERRMERAREKASLSICYFGSLDGVRWEDLRDGLRGGAVLIALKDKSPIEAKRILESILQAVKQTGGSIYLIKSPSILIVGESARLEIRG